jgi:putative RNA 2'-phosphotransferase
MLNEQKTTQISKFLSLILRHKPETIGITLDENGWTEVATLLQKAKGKQSELTLENLQYIVATNAKKRFAFDETGTKIRANQGHSVEIDLGYSPKQPPAILYHGTAEKFVSSILETGLEKRSRHHVHLSTDLETAKKVGARHGKPVIFKIFALKMWELGVVFYQSDNDVWLVDSVGIEFLEVLG